jgi:hypothetical protein
MTPAKFIIMLVVVIGVMFGVSFAVQQRTRQQRINPEASWTGALGRMLEKRQQIDLEKDFAPAGSLRDGRLVVPAASSKIVLTVTEANDRKRPIRKAGFSVSGPDRFSLRYEPSSHDSEAVEHNIKDLKPNEEVELIFLRHGGRLTFIRQTAHAPATITVR